MRPYPFQLYVTNDRKEYAKIFRRVFGEENKPIDTKGRTSTGRNAKGVMTLVVFASDYGSLVHELVHVLTMTFDHVGIPIDDKNSETFAYAIQQLFYDSAYIFNKTKT